MSSVSTSAEAMHTLLLQVPCVYWVLLRKGITTSEFRLVLQASQVCTVKAMYKAIYLPSPAQQVHARSYHGQRQKKQSWKSMYKPDWCNAIHTRQSVAHHPTSGRLHCSHQCSYYGNAMPPPHTEHEAMQTLTEAAKSGAIIVACS